MSQNSKSPSLQMEKIEIECFIQQLDLGQEVASLAFSYLNTFYRRIDKSQVQIDNSSLIKSVVYLACISTCEININMILKNQIEGYFKFFDQLQILKNISESNNKLISLVLISVFLPKSVLILTIQILNPKHKS